MYILYKFLSVKKMCLIVLQKEALLLMPWILNCIRISIVSELSKILIRAFSMLDRLPNEP